MSTDTGVAPAEFLEPRLAVLHLSSSWFPLGLSISINLILQVCILVLIPALSF